MTDKLLLRPVEVGDAIGVSRARAYALIADGTLPSIRIGASIRVPVDQLREWIQRQPSAGAAVDILERRARK